MLGLSVFQAGSQEVLSLVVPPDAEPVFSVGVHGVSFPSGVRDGAFPYELYNVAGAARFSDGSVVVVVGGYHEVRKFGPNGKHQWTFGRLGEGPREFQLPQLPQGCASDENIVVYDRLNRRVTVLDLNGTMTASYRLVFEGRQPYRMSCAPSGQVVMLGWGHPEHRPSRPGPYRWTSNLGFAVSEGSDVTVLREQVPGADRVMYFRDGVPFTEGPQTWGRDVFLAPASSGVWLGTADSYEVELVDWNGNTARRTQWIGRDLEVTPDHINTYHDGLLRAYERTGETDWRARFERIWYRRISTLPSRFPAYSALIMVGDQIWVQQFPRPGEREQCWHAFLADGTHTSNVVLPSRLNVQQAGSDWVLATSTDGLGLERLVIYTLQPIESSLPKPCASGAY